MSYPFRHPNFKHQQREFDEFKDSTARALLWQMRTGKSKAMVDLANYLHKEGKIDQVLVLAPNGVHMNWEINQLPAHSWKDTPYSCVSWSSAEIGKKSSDLQHRLESLMLKPNKQEREKLRWFCMNSEGIFYPKPKSALERFVAASKVGILLVVDECQDFRTPGSKRSSLARAIAGFCSYKRLLTGSAFDNSPLHAWAQYELLQPGALGFNTYGGFQAEFAILRMQRMGNKQFQTIDGFRNLEKLREKIGRWSSVVLRADCEDMPELNNSREVFDLAPDQRELYDRLKNQIISEEGDITTGKAFEGGAKDIKLLQVTSGFFVDEYGDVFHTKDNPRLDILKQTVSTYQENRQKVIIWCRFTQDILTVTAALKEMNLPVVQFYGAISAAKRMDNLKTFMTYDGPMAFVGNPKAGGRGLDLSAAKAILWYSRDYDLINRRQADERATYVGGTTVDVVDLLALRTVDMSIIKALEDKTTVSEQIDRTGLIAFLDGETQAFDAEIGS